MALSDFFRINLPYGIKKNSKGEWFAFNREYMPLGFNSKDYPGGGARTDEFPDLPIHTSYSGISENKLKKLAFKPEAIQTDEKGKIERVFLYDDGTNPKSKPEHWNSYFERIKLLSTLEKKV